MATVVFVDYPCKHAWRASTMYLCVRHVRTERLIQFCLDCFKLQTMTAICVKTQASETFSWKEQRRLFFFLFSKRNFEMKNKYCFPERLWVSFGLEGLVVWGSRMRVVLQRDCMLSVLVISIGILFLIQQDSGLFHVDLEVQEPKDGKNLLEQHGKEKNNNTVDFTANTRAVFLDVFIYREKNSNPIWLQIWKQYNHCCVFVQEIFLPWGTSHW